MRLVISALTSPQLYSNTFNNSDEMGKVLGIGNKTSPVSIKQIKFKIENLLTKETPDSDDFTGEF